MVDVDGVVRLKRSQRRHAAEVLARAFHDDPFYVTLVPDERGRPGRLAWFMERMLQYGLLYGHGLLNRLQIKDITLNHP